MKTLRRLLAVFVLVGCTTQAFAQNAGYRTPETRSPARSQAAPTPEASLDSGSYTSDDTSAATGRITSMNNLDDTRPLKIGDRVSLRVVEDRDKVLSLLIQDSGDIQAPFIGLVPAAGRTCKQVALHIKRELERQYFQQATVIVALERVAPRDQSFREDDMGYITIYGQVARAGRYELAPEEELSVSQAILRAGGFAQFANTKKVTVIRRLPGNKSANILVDVDRIMIKGRMEYDISIRPNDVIIVTEKKVNF